MNQIEICASLGRSLPPLFECSPAPFEGVRVRTPMMYPDGGIVDVFVLKRGETYTITDFGDALGWLQVQSISRNRSPKQQMLIKDVCQTLRIELFKGQLAIPGVDTEDLSDAVVRLAQAVVRVSDVWFTMRSQSFQTTADEIEEWLQGKRIPYERGVQKQGRSSRDWTIDFQTETERTSLIFLLSTGARGATRRVTEHVFTGCMDLSHLNSDDTPLTFVSLFDDTQDVWREHDFSLLGSCSEVALLSQLDALERTLTAP